MVEVLVEHDYVAKESNELTITKGDIIKDVIRKQGGWCEGTLKDKKGLFPDNFVKVIEKDSSVVLRNRKDVARIRQCRVVYSYKQEHEDELNLNVGDVINILGEEEEGWWRGMLNGKTGVFPSNFVEEIKAISVRNSAKEIILGQHENTPPLFAKTAKVLCEVKYAYKAQNEDELSLNEGDLVTLLSKDGQDAGWWKGELNGVVGVFPDNFVTILPSLEHPISNSVKEEKKKLPHIESGIAKPSIQRKSQDLQSIEKSETDASSAKNTPPLPGKKPPILLKKSPSSGSAPGVCYGLKKKMVDRVDGIGSSKAVSPPKIEPTETGQDSAFDDVHRRPLLSDVRATRPKAPGRRPPSVVGKETEPGIMNGNTDHTTIENLSEPASTPLNSSTDSDTADTKPKLREWEKHRAPWLEEMKLNQAKRTSGGTEIKLKLTPTEKPLDPMDTSPKSALEKELSPIKTKAMGSRPKTPSNESLVSGNIAVPPAVRSQAIQNVTDIYRHSVRVSKTPDVVAKTPEAVTRTIEAKETKEENVPTKDQPHLEQRIAKLEEVLEKLQKTFQDSLDEIRGKLQIERELRMQLQLKFEKLSQETAIQQL